jgi:hypothetical protein
MTASRPVSRRQGIARRCRYRASDNTIVAGHHALVAEWQFIDAWMLEAVAWGSFPGGSTLSQVIEVADGINHSIPNPDEVEEAMNRLLSASLLTTVDGRFSLTEAGSQLREGGPDYLFERVELLHDRLRRLPVPEDSEGWVLDHSEFDQAFRAYEERFRLIVEELDREEESRRRDP